MPVNVTVLNEDVLQLDLRAVLAEFAGDRPVRVVANLPYYITTPILMQLLEQRLPLESITVMVQKEVAERMQAQPGTKAYGALSLAVQYYTEPVICANVPPNCFMPRPNVGSAVIRLTCRKSPPVRVSDEAFLFRIIRAAFNQRRKTLANALSHAEQLPLDKERAEEAIAACGLPASVRGEALTLEQFAALAEKLRNS